MNKNKKHYIQIFISKDSVVIIMKYSICAQIILIISKTQDYKAL